MNMTIMTKTVIKITIDLNMIDGFDCDDDSKKIATRSRSRPRMLMKMEMLSSKFLSAHRNKVRARSTFR